jgi:hypothetical protein
MKTRRLLEQITSETDIALDFIEHEIGANNFVANWQAVKQRRNVPEMIGNWMRKVGIAGNPERVVAAVDKLANEKSNWLTPYTSPIPDEDILPSNMKKKDPEES